MYYSDNPSVDWNRHCEQCDKDYAALSDDEKQKLREEDDKIYRKIEREQELERVKAVNAKIKQIIDDL